MIYRSPFILLIAFRDTLGLMMRTPQHYLVSQFYDNKSSPFKTPEMHGSRGGHHGGHQGSGGGGGIIGLSRPVGVEAVRTAMEAGVLPAHAQMAHEVLQVRHEVQKYRYCSVRSASRGRCFKKKDRKWVPRLCQGCDTTVNNRNTTS